MNILRDYKVESIITVTIENWNKVNLKLFKEAKVLGNQNAVLVSHMKPEISIGCGQHLSGTMGKKLSGRIATQNGRNI